jgi:hypothetical protein
MHRCGTPWRAQVPTSAFKAIVTHALGLLPTARLADDGDVDERGPVREFGDEHLSVQRLLRGEVVEEARSLDADVVGDLGEAGRSEALIGEAS